MTEEEIFETIKESIVSIRKRKTKPIRVAINGVEGTGKTVFAGKLTEYLNSENINAKQISIDGFHFNKEVRYKQGRHSAKGYYEDSYDEIAFIEKVLKSSQSEIPNITKAIHDLETDEYLNLKPTEIDNETILITDGAYLFKPKYRKHWDLKIYLKTDFKTALFRGMNRDIELLGGLKAAKEKYDNRYHKASKIYIDENKPEEQADLIIDNTVFENLKIIKNTTANKT
jgi:uridine kinase